MLPLPKLFPDIGLKKRRAPHILEDDKGLPADSYGFVELYCVDPKCDCRQVMINVIYEKPQS